MAGSVWHSIHRPWPRAWESLQEPDSAQDPQEAEKQMSVPTDETQSKVPRRVCWGRGPKSPLPGLPPPAGPPKPGWGPEDPLLHPGGQLSLSRGSQDTGQRKDLQSDREGHLAWLATKAAVPWPSGAPCSPPRVKAAPAGGPCREPPTETAAPRHWVPKGPDGRPARLES